MTDCPCDEFDVGDDRLAELAARLGDETRALLAAQPDETWLFLTALVARLEEPGTVEDLLAVLADEPLTVWRTLVEATTGDAAEADRGLLDRYLSGDATADEVRAWGEEQDAEMLAEAIGPMQREVVARRQQLEAGRHPGELVVEATNGYELSEDLPVDRVLLLPSYWFRPWLIISRIDDAEVLTSPVADEHLALPSAAPPPSLVKLTKALGDEGRLRLLRRMGGGPITLADAMDELDLAKTTAHHHLSILRQAGLVVIRGEGRDSRYALRAHAPAAAAKALEEYLGSAVPLTEDVAGCAPPPRNASLRRASFVVLGDTKPSPHQDVVTPPAPSPCRGTGDAMSPSTSSSGPSASRPGRTETSRFRCACGRSVAAQRGSRAAATGLCSSCRSRRQADAPLHRT